MVNNAGIMIFGEVEWLTEKHIASQINVNLLGTIRITKSMCPLLRKYNGKYKCCAVLFIFTDIMRIVHSVVKLIENDRINKEVQFTLFVELDQFDLGLPGFWNVNKGQITT